MLKIGITGGIGSGKTTVCRIFEVLGIPVFYADSVARSVMHTDTVLRDEITGAFGPGSYSKEGELDRKYLASLVFNDKDQLEKLNSLVHPAVFRAFDEWVLLQKDTPYVCKEAALLFESGSYRMCDQTVLVKSPLDMRISRIMKRDNVSEQEVRARMARQFSDEQKENMADHIIINDENILLIPQILTLHRSFLNVPA